MAELIDLLRHGRTEGGEIFRGHFDVALSGEGREEMRASAEGQSWSRIVSSPLIRCQAFAASVAETQGIELTLDPRLKEYGFGEWDGQPMADVMAREGDLVRRFFDDPFNHSPPNGEDFHAFSDRVRAAWEDLANEPEPGHLLVVTHGGVIINILAQVLGRDRLHGRIDVPYASISRIAPGRDGYPHRLMHHGAGPIPPRA